MAIGDGRHQDGILSNLVPINLAHKVRITFARKEVYWSGELTSLRFFCFRIANRKRAMALSALGDIVAEFKDGKSSGLKYGSSIRDGHSDKS